MANSLAPGFVKLRYSSSLGDHTATLGCQPFLDVSSAWMLDRAGVAASITWGAAVTAYVAVCKPLMHTSTTFTTAELWTVASPGADPLFRELFEIAEAGTSASPTVPAAQATFSYRSTTGGNGKVVLLDGIFAVNQKLLPTAYGAAVYKNWADYVAASDTWVTARDNGFAFAGVKVLTKTNDVLRKKYGYV